MSFCRATRTYFNASEGVEATNQFGEKRLYSPYAEFHYCMDCGERLVTEQEKIDEENELLQTFLHESHREYAEKAITKIKLFNKINKLKNKTIKLLEKEGIVVNREDLTELILLKLENDTLFQKVACKRELVRNLVYASQGSIYDEIRIYKKGIKRGDYRIIHDDRVDSKGDYLCDNCRDEYTVCGDCGQFVKRENTTEIETIDGDIFVICDDCLNDHYVLCEECEKWINTTQNGYENIDGRIVCGDCVSEYYTRCTGCDEWIRTEDAYITDDDYYFCGYCYHDTDRVVTCRDCGRTVHRNNAYYDEDNDEYICNRCRQSSRGIIHDYSYKPRAKKHGRSKDKEYFGFEIEVDGSQYKAKSFLQEFGDEQQEDLYIKRDGSVDGFEIVTHPMSRKYFYTSFVPKLEKGMAYLRKNGFRGHNRAGIHIHVSTEAISEDMLKKMMILMYPKQKKVYKIWLKITQRREDQMHWCSMKPDNLLNGDKKYVANKIDECKRNKENGYRVKKPDLSYERYTAINCRNRNTVEFRIFNSSIRTERIIKNAQVIFALIDFTKTDRMPTMSNYLKFIENNSKVYPELYDFLIEKEILQPKKQKEKIEELMNVLNVKSINGLKESLTSIQEKQQKIAEEENLNVEDDERNEQQCA